MRLFRRLKLKTSNKKEFFLLLLTIQALLCPSTHDCSSKFITGCLLLTATSQEFHPKQTLGRLDYAQLYLSLQIVGAACLIAAFWWWELFLTLRVKSKISISRYKYLNQFNFRKVLRLQGELLKKIAAIYNHLSAWSRILFLNHSKKKISTK